MVFTVTQVDQNEQRSGNTLGHKTCKMTCVALGPDMQTDIVTVFMITILQGKKKPSQVYFAQQLRGHNLNTTL